MGYIYKINNSINDKVYIGQTVQKVLYRFKNHLWSSENRKDMKEYPLYRAIRKYGKENFSVEIIEEIADSSLNEREIYWIKYYNSFVPNGYNCTLGGGGNQKYSESQKQKMLEYFLTEGERNYSKTQKQFNCSFEILYNYINSKGYNSTGKTNSLKCFCLHKDTKELLEFISVLEASKQLNISDSTIYSSITNRILTAKGYFCSYSLEECYNKYNNYYLNHPKIICVETNQVFPSVRKASEWLINNNKTTVKIPQQLDANIRRAIKKEIKSYGYHWKYYLGDD